MKKLKDLLWFILIIAFSTNLAGCKIISVEPDTDEIIYLEPGETQVFKVIGLVTEANPNYKYRWSIEKAGSDAEVFDDYSGEFKLVTNPEDDALRIVVSCELMQFGPYCHTKWGDCWNGWCEERTVCGLEWGTIDSRVWNINTD